MTRALALLFAAVLTIGIPLAAAPAEAGPGAGNPGALASAELLRNLRAHTGISESSARRTTISARGRGTATTPLNSGLAVTVWLQILGAARD